MSKFRPISLIFALLYLVASIPYAVHAQFEEIESEDTQYTSPQSTFTSSNDVAFFGTEGAQTVRHVNVTEDDTRTDNTVKVQERTEFNTETNITVLGNMGSGSAAKIYSSDQLVSQTGEPTEKKGVEETPYGYSARFTTTGTKFIEPNRPRTDFSQKPEPEEEVTEAKTDDGPRVLVS